MRYTALGIKNDENEINRSSDSGSAHSALILPMPGSLICLTSFPARSYTRSRDETSSLVSTEREFPTVVQALRGYDPAGITVVAADWPAAISAILIAVMLASAAW